jgi:hypothetical protein
MRFLQNLERRLACRLKSARIADRKKLRITFSLLQSAFQSDQIAIGGFQTGSLLQLGDLTFSDELHIKPRRWYTAFAIDPEF